MKIVVASENPSKIEAVRDILKDYEILMGAEIFSVKPQSDMVEQPVSWRQIIQGAINRARNAFREEYNYSFGMESGVVQLVPEIGRFDFGACSIYDGKKEYLGFSCGFEIPRLVQKILEDKWVDLSEACKIAGITTEQKVGAGEGLIGILTGRRVTRKDQIKQAVQMALIGLENPGMYS